MWVHSNTLCVRAQGFGLNFVFFSFPCTCTIYIRRRRLPSNAKGVRCQTWCIPPVLPRSPWDWRRSCLGPRSKPGLEEVRRKILRSRESARGHRWVALVPPCKGGWRRSPSATPTSLCFLLTRALLMTSSHSKVGPPAGCTLERSALRQCRHLLWLCYCG